MLKIARRRNCEPIRFPSLAVIFCEGVKRESIFLKGIKGRLSRLNSQIKLRRLPISALGHKGDGIQAMSAVIPTVAPGSRNAAKYGVFELIACWGAGLGSIWGAAIPKKRVLVKPRHYFSLVVLLLSLLAGWFAPLQL